MSVEEQRRYRAACDRCGTAHRRAYTTFRACMLAARKDGWTLIGRVWCRECSSLAVASLEVSS